MVVDSSKKVLFCLLLTLSTFAIAAPPENPITNDSSTQPSTPSNSIEFARQAGTIAGMAQACGENITHFSEKITEEIKKMTNNPTDQAGALFIYQQIIREAEKAERTTQPIPCEKVREDFLSLPIMQTGYKQP